MTKKRIYIFISKLKSFNFYIWVYDPPWIHFYIPWKVWIQVYFPHEIVTQLFQHHLWKDYPLAIGLSWQLCQKIPLIIYVCFYFYAADFFAHSKDNITLPWLLKCYVSFLKFSCVDWSKITFFSFPNCLGYSRSFVFTC